MAPHLPADLRVSLERTAGAAVELRFRPMFGGLTAYAGGKAFASLSDVGLALKLAPDDRAALLAEPGAEPLRYAPDMPPSRQYVTVPPGLLNDPGTLSGWITRSAGYVAALPAKAGKPGRKL